jgi:hypothetical protein
MVAEDSDGKSWKAVLFTCPYCFKVLGAGYDAVAQTPAIVAQVVEKLTRAK